jgi:hypothetical protein
MSYDFKIGPVEDTPEVFEWSGLTYNVGPMLKRAGFHPNILNGMTVVELRPVVSNALAVLKHNQEYFEQFNPENGWGDYGGVLVFLLKLERYLYKASDSYVMRVF